MHAVVEARHVHHLGKAATQCLLGTVHALGHGARGIQPVADVLQSACNGGAVLAALFGNLVAYRPHHDRRVVAVGPHQRLHVAVAPFLEETGIAVLALGVDPHVERLGHDHHAQ